MSEINRLAIKATDPFLKGFGAVLKAGIFAPVVVAYAAEAFVIDPLKRVGQFAGKLVSGIVHNEQPVAGFTRAAEPTFVEVAPLEQ